jgi:hypothetical protein
MLECLGLPSRPPQISPKHGIPTSTIKTHSPVLGIKPNPGDKADQIGIIVPFGEVFQMAISGQQSVASEETHPIPRSDVL